MTDCLAPILASHRRWLSTAASALLLPMLVAVASLPAAAAQPADSRSAAETRYQQESAACRDGRSPQGRDTCLKEAGAARAEARRQGLDNGETAAQLRANALLRCQRVTASDRAACERMVQGEGQRSGTVSGGGVLTQITTPDTIAPAASAASR